MQLKTKFYWCCGVLALAFSANAAASGPVLQKTSVPAQVAAPTRHQVPDYVLGPGDVITLIAVDADEISNKPMRISNTGDISVVQGVGRIHAAGMTVQQLEAEIAERLKRIIRVPEVFVSVTEFRSQPVTVTGAVGTPGTKQLEGGKDLLEVLALAGGASLDASSMITITRDTELNGPIPLASASTADGSAGLARCARWT